MTTLLLATRNAHKAAEIHAILGNDFRLLTLDDFVGAPKVIEDADSFAGNATKKAVELAKWIAGKHSTLNIQLSTPNFVLADDSGLEVDPLNGAPGVHSARFAAMDRSEDGSSANPAGNSSDADNNAKLLRLLQNVPAEERTARFHCVVALAAMAGGASVLASRGGENIAPEERLAGTLAPPVLFDGVCEGRIIFAPRGEDGFGYDPLFVPDGFEQTFAELGDEVKNQLSHRARALAKLKAFFRTT